MIPNSINIVLNSVNIKDLRNRTWVVIFLFSLALFSFNYDSYSEIEAKDFLIEQSFTTWSDDGNLLAFTSESENDFRFETVTFFYWDLMNNTITNLNSFRYCPYPQNTVVSDCISSFWLGSIKFPPLWVCYLLTFMGTDH